MAAGRLCDFFVRCEIMLEVGLVGYFVGIR